MKMEQPFAGLGSANYLEAFSPDSGKYFLNSGQQQSYDGIFEPRPIETGPSYLKILAIGVALFFIYSMFKKEL